VVKRRHASGVCRNDQRPRHTIPVCPCVFYKSIYTVFIPYEEVETMYAYPLELSFKIMALAPQIAVRDAHGQLLFYVKQKLFKLKEAITVFADEAQQVPRYFINADRVIDFSARYTFTLPDGRVLGAVKRQGAKSLWKAHYDIFTPEGAQDLVIEEENPFVKLMDGLLGEIPVLNLFTGYLFNPTYLVKDSAGTAVMRLKKQPSFFESKFAIGELTDIPDETETRVILSLLLMILLERSRG